MRKYCLDAAHLAESSNANEEAISYYRQALDLMGTRSSSNMTSWIAIKKSLINLNLTTGHFNDALQIANELLPLIEDRLEKAKLYKNIGSYVNKKYPLCYKGVYIILYFDDVFSVFTILA